MEKKLKEKFIEIVNEYVAKFEEKQEMFLDFWISDDVGGIACFGDYYFNLDNIRTDIDLDVPPGLILRWQDHNMELGSDKSMNYISYIRGLRLEPSMTTNMSRTFSDSFFFSLKD